MTRKEIEKRCREEMQQTISDKEALWERIESRLPEQQPAQQPAGKKPHIQMMAFARIAAACLLLVIVGAKSYQMFQKSLHSAKPDEDQSYFTAEESSEEEAEGSQKGEDAWDVQYGDAAEKNEGIAAPEASTSDEKELLHYSDLAVPGSGSIHLSVPLKAPEGSYFSEADVLEQTACFVDVIVQDGVQGLDTGAVVYSMEVVDCYGAEVPENSLTIVSDTPYLLEIGHEYVLPLRQTGDAWELTDACAPQFERTQDGKVLFQSGWYSLMTEESVPVLCDSRGTDDYFYDRMYLTGYAELEAFLREWERQL